MIVFGCGRAVEVVDGKIFSLHIVVSNSYFMFSFDLHKRHLSLLLFEDRSFSQMTNMHLIFSFNIKTFKICNPHMNSIKISPFTICICHKFQSRVKRNHACRLHLQKCYALLFRPSICTFMFRMFDTIYIKYNRQYITLIIVD